MEEGARQVLVPPFKLPSREEVARVFGEEYGDRSAKFHQYVPAPLDFSRSDYEASKGQRLRNRISLARPTNPAMAHAENDYGKKRFFRQLDYFHMAAKSYNEFEILTVEMVDALADYVIGRYSGRPGGVTIAEVGAGRGRLALQMMIRLPSDIRYVASDSNAWGLGSYYTAEGLEIFARSGGVRLSLPIVESLDFEEAMKKHKPDVVIVSWMPQMVDFSAAIRRVPSVKEYILIGTTDMGMNGHIWDTWGGDASVKPWQSDGWDGLLLEQVAQHQLCLIDRPGFWFNSSCMSFRRRAAS